MLNVSCQEDTVEPDLFGELVGQVLLEADNSAIANATISTNPPTSTVLTDNLGRFSFDNIKTGTYTIRAEKAGFVTAIESVSIFENQTANVVIKLNPVDGNNLPPTAPTSPTPANNSNDLPIDLALSWQAADPDSNALTFDLYLFNSLQGPGQLLAEDLTETTYALSGLKYGTTYFWQVAAKDGMSDPVFSETWSFSTEPFPAHPFVFVKINNGKYDLYAAQSASPADPLYLLTENAGSNFRPRFSPNGNRIAYISNIAPEAQLFTIKRDGTEPALVPAPIPIDGYDVSELDFAWSPDGTKLLYMRFNQLFTINSDGSGHQLFAEINLPDAFVEVDWSPVTNRIAARCRGALPYHSKILLFDSDGTYLEDIVDDLPGNIGGPVFSVSGNSILYTHDVDGLETPDGRQLNSHIFLKNLTSGDVTDLSIEKPIAPGTNDLDPRFSPDGNLIIFTNTLNVQNAARQVWIMNIQGKARTKLFENAEMPDWR